MKYSKAKDAASAYEAVKAEIESGAILREFKIDAAVEYYPNDYRIVATGKGFELTLTMLKKRVEIDLILTSSIQNLLTLISEIEILANILQIQGY